MHTTSPYLSGAVAVERVANLLSVLSQRSSAEPPAFASVLLAVQGGWIDRDGMPTQAGYRLMRRLSDVLDDADEHDAAA